MKIVFAGTPEFALPVLRALLESGKEIVGVVTQEDKPQGRKGILTPSPVKRYALERGLVVLTPKKIREETESVKALGADIMITCAYGQILTQEVIDLFPKGIWNVHAGLLPYYRGASPIQSAIRNGEKVTGVCFMRTELGLDTGDVLLCGKEEIGERDTFQSLSERLSLLGAKLTLEGLDKIERGELTLTPQGEEGARVYKKISGEEGKIDFTRSAREISCLVRAFNPEPIAYCYVGETRLNVFFATPCLLPEDGKDKEAGTVLCDKPKGGLIVACGKGEAVRFEEVQLAGGKRMKDSDFLNGRKLEKGQTLC